MSDDLSDLPAGWTPHVRRRRAADAAIAAMKGSPE